MEVRLVTNRTQKYIPSNALLFTLFFFQKSCLLPFEGAIYILRILRPYPIKNTTATKARTVEKGKKPTLSAKEKELS